MHRTAFAVILMAWLMTGCSATDASRPEVSEPCLLTTLSPDRDIVMSGGFVTIDYAVENCSTRDVRLDHGGCGPFVRLGIVAWNASYAWDPAQPEALPRDVSLATFPQPCQNETRLSPLESLRHHIIWDGTVERSVCHVDRSSDGTFTMCVPTPGRLEPGDVRIELRVGATTDGTSRAWNASRILTIW